VSPFVPRGVVPEKFKRSMVDSVALLAMALESRRGPTRKTSRVVRCAATPSAHGATMENITPPGTPAKRALAVLDQPAPTTDIGPPKRISKRVRAAIDAMVTGECKTIKEAAEKVGLARESLSRALSTPHVAEHLRMKVLRTLAMAAARAGAVKIDLMDSDNAIARDRASSFVLGLAGIAPATSPSLSLNIEVKAGYVIDLSDDPPPMRTVSRITAPAIEHAEGGND
jgi:hypothetical protein